MLGYEFADDVMLGLFGGLAGLGGRLGMLEEDQLLIQRGPHQVFPVGFGLPIPVLEVVGKSLIDQQPQVESVSTLLRLLNQEVGNVHAFGGRDFRATSRPAV